MANQWLDRRKWGSVLEGLDWRSTPSKQSHEREGRTPHIEYGEATGKPPLSWSNHRHSGPDEELEEGLKYVHDWRLQFKTFSKNTWIKVPVSLEAYNKFPIRTNSCKANLDIRRSSRLTTNWAIMHTSNSSSSFNHLAKQYLSFQHANLWSRIQC